MEKQDTAEKIHLHSEKVSDGNLVSIKDLKSEQPKAELTTVQAEIVNKSEIESNLFSKSTFFRSVVFSTAAAYFSCFLIKGAWQSYRSFGFLLTEHSSLSIETMLRSMLQIAHNAGTQGILSGFIFTILFLSLRSSGKPKATSVCLSTLVACFISITTGLLVLRFWTLPIVLRHDYQAIYEYIILSLVSYNLILSLLGSATALAVISYIHRKTRVNQKDGTLQGKTSS